MKTSTHSVTDARVHFSRIVRAANIDGVITFLTSNGLRVAAIVPLQTLQELTRDYRDPADPGT